MLGLILVVTLSIRTIWLLLSDAAFRSLVFGSLVVLAAGTSFYTFSEDWSFVDALYFSVVSLTTVGYGDLTPTSDAAKLFTIVYLLSGVALLMGFINAAANIRRERLEASLQSRKAASEAKES